MRRWPTEKQFAAGLGRCPLHKISGGKIRSRKVRPSANRAAGVLRLAASCLPHSQSALGAFSRRLKARGGTPKAVVATAHKLNRTTQHSYTQAASCEIASSELSAIWRVATAAVTSGV
jgi:transposase